MALKVLRLKIETKLYIKWHDLIKICFESKEFHSIYTIEKLSEILYRKLKLSTPELLILKEQLFLRIKEAII